MHADKLKYLKTDLNQESISAQFDLLDNDLGKLASRDRDLSLVILNRFDAIQTRLHETYPHGSIPTEYQVQWDYLQDRLRKQAGLVLQALGGGDALKVLRQEHNPPQSAWWWFLDDFLSQQRRTSGKKFARVAGLVAVIIILLVSAYQLFLAPPPEVRARIRHEYAASRHMENGDFQAALQELDLALALEPNHYQLLTQQGVIYLKMGNQVAADQALLKAEAAAESPELYYLERAQNELVLGMNEDGLQDAQNAIEANPQSALAHLLVGQAYEQMGNGQAAYAAYEIASSLADTQADVELLATVRMRMGMLLQSLSLSSPAP